MSTQVRRRGNDPSPDEGEYSENDQLVTEEDVMLEPANFSTGILIFGAYVLAQIVITLVITIIVAASIGDNFDSVTAGSMGWWTVAFFLFSNMAVLAALFISATPNKGVYWFGFVIIGLSVAAAWMAFVLLACVFLSNQSCYEQSYCTEDPVWIPNPNPTGPHPKLAPGVEVRAFDGIKATFGLLLANAAIMTIFAVVAFIATGAWRQEGRPRLPDRGLWKSVAHFVFGFILIGLHLLIVLIFLGTRAGTPTGALYPREVPTGGEFQYIMFVLFVVMGAALPLAIILIAVMPFSSDATGARGCASLLAYGIAAVALFFCVLYLINVTAVVGDDRCCARIEDIDVVQTTALNSTIPNENEIDRSLLCGAYRADDAVIAGRNTYCGWVSKYTPATTTTPYVLVVEKHGDFTAGVVLTWIFVAAAAIALFFAAILPVRRSNAMFDNFVASSKERISAARGRRRK